MRKVIEDYITKCDTCQCRKDVKITIAPLGKLGNPKIPFEVTALDVTGLIRPLPVERKLSSRLLIIVQYAIAFPIPDQTAESRATMSSTDVILFPGNMQDIRNSLYSYLKLPPRI